MVWLSLASWMDGVGGVELIGCGSGYKSKAENEIRNEFWRR